MTKVFIGGSRRIARLGKPVLERLESIVNQGHAVVVGDANGVDKAVQKFFLEKGYKNVEVFVSGKECRNNLGGWRVRQVPLLNGKRGFGSYSARDLAMANEAGVGFFIWDGKSKGTLNNILSMLSMGKNSLVFACEHKRLVTVRAKDDLKQLGHQQVGKENLLPPGADKRQPISEQSTFTW